MPDLDETGDQLLKHARVYTLAEKLGMGTLKTLAHSKIHCVNSSAKGEIAYARYVYATTQKEDDTIRKPVASFWAHRSHVLRREAEDEFRQMCLEFPQFAFDVLCKFYSSGCVYTETNVTLQRAFSTRSSRRREEARRPRQLLDPLASDRDRARFRGSLFAMKTWCIDFRPGSHSKVERDQGVISCMLMLAISSSYLIRRLLLQRCAAWATALPSHCAERIYPNIYMLYH